MLAAVNVADPLAATLTSWLVPPSAAFASIALNAEAASTIESAAAAALLIVRPCTSGASPRSLPPQTLCTTERARQSGYMGFFSEARALCARRPDMTSA